MSAVAVPSGRAGRRGPLTMTVRGELTQTTRRVWQVKGRAMLQQGGYRLDLDLSQVRFIVSTGLGMLVVLRNEAIRNAGALRVTAASPTVQRLLEITGMVDLLASAETDLAS